MKITILKGNNRNKYTIWITTFNNIAEKFLNMKSPEFQIILIIMNTILNGINTMVKSIFSPCSLLHREKEFGFRLLESSIRFPVLVSNLIVNKLILEHRNARIQ